MLGRQRRAAAHRPGPARRADRADGPGRPAAPRRPPRRRAARRDRRADRDVQHHARPAGGRTRRQQRAARWPPRKPSGSASPRNCTTRSARPSPPSCSDSNAPPTARPADCGTSCARCRRPPAPAWTRSAASPAGCAPACWRNSAWSAPCNALAADFTTQRTDGHPHARPGTAPAEHETELVLYRVAQESLTNIARHADARTWTWRCATARPASCCASRDDGRGIGGAPEGAGIRGMRERALLIGADLTLGATARRHRGAPDVPAPRRSHVTVHRATTDPHPARRRPRAGPPRRAADPGRRTRPDRRRRGRRRRRGHRDGPRPTDSTWPSSTSPCPG